jgi:Twin arginine targeting (Tat) protein translocase TatC
VSIVDKFLSKRQDPASPAGEMAFTDHIEALRWHIVRAVIAIAICGIVVFFNIEWIFENVIMGPAKSDFLSYRVLCKLGQMTHLEEALCLKDMQIKFQNTELSGQFMMSFSSSFMIGFIVAFPYIFWEFWKFIKPALTENELRNARGIIFWVSILFFFGIVFAYYVIAPFTINFFANYKLASSFENIITINSYYDSMSDLILGMGLVFELPVLAFFLSKVGILTPRLMREKRNYAIVIIFVLAAVITPPDWFSIFLVAIPLVMLYEVSIRISARVQNNKRKKELVKNY